ncbi:MAG: helix-turn-helix domain-containing protein [Candidatus Contendobacter sp.]|jgi:putative transcriptional regulator|nr:helix-turn-helix domain-containing protein [Candidatus Contendobacter sp.]
MNTADITPTTPDQAEPIDWTRFDAMGAEARHRAALDDPDVQPLTEADFARMKRTPQAKLIRRALDLTQEEFAVRYHIPLGTLRDWEQGRAQPDPATRAYLTVIARDPEGVQRALQPPSRG